MGRECLPPDRHAYGACRERHQDESGQEGKVERVGHETREKLLDAVERDRRRQAGGERDDGAEGEERTRVVECSEPAGRIWMWTPDAGQRIRLRAREGGEHAPQGAARPVRHRGAQVGIDLARAQHGVAGQVDEDREHGQPNDDVRQQILAHQRDNERSDGDQEERVPDREREVRDPDVAVADVSELVPNDRPEGGRVDCLLHDQPAADRDAVPARMPEGKASRGRVERIPEESRWSELLLAGELRNLFHHCRRIRRSQWP